MGTYGQGIFNEIAPKSLNRKHISFSLVHITDNDIQGIVLCIGLNQGQGSTTLNMPCSDSLVRMHGVKFIQKAPGWFFFGGNRKLDRIRYTCRLPESSRPHNQKYHAQKS